jgi:drug/metabolite transporter (DMT)-like permease
VGLRPEHKADLALLSISALWGSTFVVVKRALLDAPPFAFLALRFLIAAGALALVFRREIRSIRPATMAGGSMLGVLLCAGFALQTFGLLYVSPSRSAFITGLYVVGVPILAATLRLRGFNAGSLVGVVLALAGLYLMTGPGAPDPGLSARGGIGTGELLTILCAVAFAGQIVGVDVFTRDHDARTLAFLQVGIGGVLYVPLWIVSGAPRINPTPALIGAILVTSIGGTALAFAVQNAVQSRTTPTRAAIIFTSEPVFAGITSYVVEGERLPAVAIAGAGLILAGMIAAEVSPAQPRTAGSR